MHSMKALLFCLLFAACLAARPALAACEKPTLPDVPDGETATEQELLAVQARVEAYVAGMDLYIACENEAMTAEAGQTTAEFLILMSDRIASARDEVDVVATRFNAQVEAFRAAQSPSTFTIQ